ncbi:MAG: phosphatase PAP2 family protein [Pseudomonadota bacterium]
MRLRETLAHAAARRGDAIAPGAFSWLFTLSALCAALGIGLFAIDGSHQIGFVPFNALARPAPDWLLANLTEVGNTAVLVAVALVTARRHPQLLIALVVAVLFGAIVINVLKDAFAVPRPPAVLDPQSFRLVGDAHQRGSFPSGHTFATFSVAAIALGFVTQPMARLSIIIGAVCVACARVWVGVHWPLDLVGGAFGGLLTGALALAVSRHWHGGFHPFAHLAMVSVAVLSNVVLIIGGTNYAAADPLMRTVALASTLVVAWQYLRPTPGPTAPTE